jgi:hypothetical protein
MAAGTPWWKKLLWLVAIWTASVAALAIVAYGMKLLMRSAGLSD